MEPSHDVSKKAMGVDVNSLLKSQSISPSLRKHVERADVDGDGIISVEELIKLLETEQILRRERTLLIRIVSALGVACVLIIAAVVGLTYAVVHLSKDTSVQNNVLVGKGTSDAISTAGIQATYPLSEWYRVQSMSELEGLTRITIPFEDGISIFKIQDIHLIPNKSIRFDTSSENVSITVSESGISVSGDDRNSSSSRRLLSVEMDGTVSGQVIGRSTGVDGGPCKNNADCASQNCVGYFEYAGITLSEGMCVSETEKTDKLGKGSQCQYSIDCEVGTVCGLPTIDSRQKVCCVAEKTESGYYDFDGTFCPGVFR